MVFVLKYVYLSIKLTVVTCSQTTIFVTKHIPSNN